MERIQLHKAPIRRRVGADIIMRYGTLSGDLIVTVEEGRRVVATTTGEYIDGWRADISTASNTTKRYVADIVDATALPFFVADLVAELQALPRSAAADPEQKQISAMLKRLYSMYDVYSPGKNRFPCVTMQKTLVRLEKYPRRAIDEVPHPTA